jgi:hypothetical protein
MLLPSGSARSIEHGIREMWDKRDQFVEREMHAFVQQFRWENIAQQLHGAIEEALHG